MKIEIFDASQYLKEQLTAVEALSDISPDIAVDLVSAWSNYVFTSLEDLEPCDVIEGLTIIKEFGLAEEAIQAQIDELNEY